VPDVDESPRDGEGADAHVRRLASDKAAAVGRSSATHDSDVIVAADTVVVVDGAILGKPRDDIEAAAMLRQLSGRWHEVLTGVAIRSGSREIVDVATSRVQLASLSEADIVWYVTSGEGRDKAGAYAIQGLASRFIPRIDGSYANVVGLPVALVWELLKRL